MIRVADRVLSRDENDPNGIVVVQTVEEVFVREALVWELRVGGQTIRTTAEHPFFVMGQGWTKTFELREGDSLLCEDGTIAKVQSLKDTSLWEKVYNFRVSEFHTYFVRCAEWGFAVWAHNQSCTPGLSGEILAEDLEYQALKNRLRTEEILPPARLALPSGPPRVSYAGMYYDAANRETTTVNVGTNGGAAWTRPGTVPSRSNSVLVSSTIYDNAGRAVETIDPLGLITQTTYDLMVGYGRDDSCKPSATCLQWVGSVDHGVSGDQWFGHYRHDAEYPIWVYAHVRRHE